MQGHRRDALPALAVKPGRNDPCSCGSGRKYKYCCGAARAAASRAPAYPHPRPVTAELERARRLREAGDVETAASVLQQAVLLSPDNAAAHNDLGLLHLRSRRPAEAIRCFARAVALDPKMAIAHYNFGTALEQQGDNDAAIGAYRRAVSIAPKLADAHERLGNLLLAYGIRAEALDCFRRVAQLVPNATLGRLNRAKVLHDEGRLAEAESCLRRTVALDRASSEAHRCLGNILRELGRFDEAIACFDRAIALNPDEVAAHHDLVQSKRVTEADRPIIMRMLSLLSGSGVTDKDRVTLHFALGKGCDDLADYEQAIRYFDEGNGLARRGVRFDRAQFAVGINRLIGSFTAEFFREHRALGTECETPVLILGMMRSGTTLVEQILSSHPKVAGGNELSFWGERAEAYARSGGEGQTPAYLGKLADDYVALLREIGPQAARVTDKMPGNFLWIGLIHLVFPRAYIIHCRRHPVDTCLSIYTTNFNWRKDFAYDRGDLVFYYQQYARLMAHWRRVLPPDRFLEVDYEELIANPEEVSRRLVAFIGLDWDDACLRPESNRRPVKTASMWQARQPVYRTSVERWRRYEPWLGEFRQLLTENGGASAATSIDPRSASAARQIADRLHKGGKLVEAVSVLQRAILHGPPDPAAYNDLGLLLLYSHRVEEAVDSFERAIALDPNFTIGHYNLAAAFERQRRRDEAIAAYRRSIALDPNLAAAHSRLGDLLHAAGDRAQALDCFARAAAASPDSTLGRLNRAKWLLVEEKLVEAEECLRDTIACDPQSSEAQRLLGNMLREAGQFAEATACLDRAIALDPERISAYHDLVHSKRVTEADRPLLAQMAALIERDGFTDHERTLLHFALGKAFDDLAAYEQAIRHFDAGNRLERAGLSFDREQLADRIDRLIAGFTAEFFAANTALGSDYSTPVLILGMPRSGTTLVEQIVSSHPKVGAAGELTFWNDRDAALADARTSYLEPNAARALADDYIALLRRVSPTALRVTDKMPFNFLHIGLIRQVFPNAFIVHCRRNPVDTCLSIYFTRFATRQAFAYDRGDLVFYYRHYARLMAHWRQVLPPDRFLEVDYEHLIANREKVTHRLIAFLGLDWDEACLRPEDNPRLVKTASLWQARQPVYDTAVERWRRYEPWLGELRLLLREAARD
jgi:tetratricopeptide (TPR) repeat protein